MPDPNDIFLRSTTSGEHKAFAPGEVAAAVKSGDWEQYSGSSTTVNLQGAEMGASPAQVQSGVAGAVVFPAAEAATARTQATRDAYDTITDKVFTAAEGAADALSLGLLHERGDLADVRRDVNSGSALAGEIFGSAIGMELPGPVGAIARGSEGLGSQIAEAMRLGKVGGSVATDSLVGGSLGAAAAAGHQTFDALIENKDLSVEAVMKEATIDGLVGGAFGLAHGALGKLARGTKGDVIGQGGFMDTTSDDFKSATDHVADAKRMMDEAVDRHGDVLAGAQDIHDRGWYNLNDDMMKQRFDALKAAQTARDAVPDVAKAMAKGDPKFTSSMDAYQEKLDELDKVMALTSIERITPTKLNALDPADLPGYGAEWGPNQNIENIYKPGEVPIQNLGVNANMEVPLQGKNVVPSAGAKPVFRPGIEDPRARYQEIYGRPWEPLDEGQLPSDEPTSPNRVAADEHQVARSATPEAKTGIGKARELPNATNPGEFPRAQEMVPGDLDADINSARELKPRDTADALNGNYLKGGLSILPDGSMAPAVDIRANAEAFDRFRSKMDNDTLANRARKAESFNKLRADMAAQSAPEPMGEPGPGALKRGRGPEYRDTELQSPAERKLLDRETLGRARTEMHIPGPEIGEPVLKGGLEDLNRALGLDGETPADQIKATGDRAQAEHARQFMDNWYDQSRKMGPRERPGDVAAAKISQLQNELYTATGGRADAVSALQLGEKAGFEPPRSALTQRVQGVMLLRQAANDALETAKVGRATGGGTGAPGKGKSASWLKRRLSGVAGAKLGAVVGGPAGALAGWHLGAAYAGGASEAAMKFASAAGRAARRVAEVGEKLLAGHKGTAAAVAVRNRPYAYSEAGPIKDPVERILELKRVAATPQAIKANVIARSGDLAVIHNEIASKLGDATTNAVVQLSLRAPAIAFDRTGNPMAPAANALRKFLQYENAVHNIDEALERIGAGNASDMDVAAMKETAPEHYNELMRGVLGEPDLLSKLTNEGRRYVERITGLPLTGRGNPAFAQQQAAAWQSANTPPSPPKPGGGAAMKPTAAGMATPAQGAPDQRAPGN